MKNFIWAAGAVIVSVLISLLGGGHHGLFGAITSPATNLDYLQLSQGLQIPGGPSITTTSQGTNIQAIFHGSCNLAQSAANTPLVASSTGLFTCAASNIVAGDRVFVEPAYASATSTFLTDGIEFVAASSTAAGVITVKLYNSTGAATSSFAQATTGWQYFVIR